MSSKLQNLYTYLIDNQKPKLAGWHKAYRHFYNEVQNIRHRIQAGDRLSPSTDEEFLRKLLYEKNNGIASRGQSVLADETFKSLINNPDFISALEALILDPHKDSFTQFEVVWATHAKSKNPLLVNRVAAACTFNVSTTVDASKFNQLFDWLIEENIITVEPAERQGNWFEKNCSLMKYIHKELLNSTTDEFYLNQFVWQLYLSLSHPFSLKKQIVMYGAPGTGKTYQARQQTKLQFDIWKEAYAPQSTLTYDSQTELVQFHPSFTYEDFVEGLRPDINDHGSASLTLRNGIFKEFCQRAGKWEMDLYRLAHDSEAKWQWDEDWESLTVGDLMRYKERLTVTGEYWQSIFQISDLEKRLFDAIPPFFFIIDEVNRAELSRVFGELMYCLEYRGVHGRVKTQYAHLNTEKTAMLQNAQGNWFFIPSNIYLIGTMNTIDRSVESFDFALRRRFHWEEVKPDTEVLKYHLLEFCESWSPLAQDLQKLNDWIAQEPLLGNEYQIGHAYLMNLKYPKKLSVEEVRQRIWNDSIRPLLQEYLRGTGKEKDLIIDKLKKGFGGI